MIIRKIMWGAPKPGLELEYALAWKHRHGWMAARLARPWWQWRKRRIGWDAWARAVDRIKRNGQHVFEST